MTDGGILLALPAQSVAVRLVLGALVAIVLTRLLLRADIRSAGVRVAFAVLPVGVLATLVVASLAAPRLPTLLVSAPDSPSQVVIGLGRDYLQLAPLTLPAILGAWAVVAFALVSLRTVRVVRTSRTARRVARRRSAPTQVRRRVVSLAARLGITPPSVVVGECPGGAAAVGIRRPVLLLDEHFVATLDDLELEGVIAHELAHIARRDNLVAYCTGLVRDLTFFLPGGTWALRQLLVERELAADQSAVQVTRRPGSLAAGLLKVLETAPEAATCAPLMPAGTLAARVTALCADQEPPRRVRTTTEVTAVAAAFTLLVATAMMVPRWLAGADPEAGLGVLLSVSPVSAAPLDVGAPDGTAAMSGAAAGTIDLPAIQAAAPPQALRSYAATVESPQRVVRATSGQPDDVTDVLSAGGLATCANADACADLAPEVVSTLELHPNHVLVQRDFDVRWHAQPVNGRADDTAMVRLYYLSSIPE